jgi:mannitol/fructose-specific phosphotransferase system IIA component (Ntr-type)
MSNEMSMNELLYKLSERAIEKLFSDTSVSVEDTISNLEALMDYIEEKLAALEHSDEDDSNY